MRGRYVRWQWTGDTRAGNTQCPSCLSYHAPSYIGCNGKREPCERRCEAVLGEIRCDRPANHIEAHQALSDALRVEWSIPHGPESRTSTSPHEGAP